MRWLQILGIGLLVGCSDDPPPEPIELVVGTGIDDFEVVSPASTLSFTQGLQGGFHVFTAVRATDAVAWNAEFDFEMYQGDVQIGGAQYQDDFLERDGALVFTGVTVFLFADLEPEEVAGKATRIVVRVKDADGRRGEAEMRFVAGCCEYLP